MSEKKEKNSEMVKIGMRIQKCRLKAGLTQEKLAECVNISQKHLSRIEQGYHNPHFDVVIKIANALHVPTDMFAEDSATENVQILSAAVTREMNGMSTMQLKMLTEAAALIKKYNL